MMDIKAVVSQVIIGVKRRINVGLNLRPRLKNYMVVKIQGILQNTVIKRNVRKMVKKDEVYFLSSTSNFNDGEVYKITSS